MQRGRGVVDCCDQTSVIAAGPTTERERNGDPFLDIIFKKSVFLRTTQRLPTDRQTLKSSGFCIACSLLGWSMVFFLAAERKIYLSLMCKISIIDSCVIPVLFFMLSDRFDRPDDDKKGSGWNNPIGKDVSYVRRRWQQ